MQPIGGLSKWFGGLGKGKSYRTAKRHDGGEAGASDRLEEEHARWLHPIRWVRTLLVSRGGDKGSVSPRGWNEARDGGDGGAWEGDGSGQRSGME